VNVGVVRKDRTFIPLCSRCTVLTALLNPQTALRQVVKTIEMKRKTASVQKTLFRFVKQAVLIARKLTDAALMQIDRPADNGVAGWKHTVLHFLRLHMDATLQEVIDWAEEMERARAALV
jgi:hypothetical protein